MVVGVIGLGDIGRGVASAVAEAGLELVVCDVREEATAAFADRARVGANPADVGVYADVLVVAVVNDKQVRAVLSGPDGALARMRAGSVVVIVSTVKISTAREMAALAIESGVGLVDCGVSGGPAAAAEGALVCMVGGADDHIDVARPVLDTFSSLVVRMGPLGAGLQAKLARNIIQYGSWLAAFEAQRLAEAAGIELAKLAQAVRESDKRIGGATTLMFRKTVEPFGADDDAGLVQAMSNAAGLARKDLAAALSLAEELGVDLPMTSVAAANMDAVFGMGEQ